MTQRKLSQFTQLVHGGMPEGENRRYANPPIVKASTVMHENVEAIETRAKNRDALIPDVPTYGIWGTETHRAFYGAMKAIEGEECAGVWAFSTGLAACSVPLMAFVKAGDHALFVDSIYGPTRDFAETILASYGVEVEFYDPLIGGDIEKLFKPNTTLVVMETPGSHSLELMDVPAIVEKCRARGIWTAIDNTWATPLFFKPLSVGVDMVMHAATKYIAGHSDLLMGVIACNARAWPKVFKVIACTGQAAGADDVYAACRGLRTIAARIEYAVKGAREIIAWFESRPEVERVVWPALPTDPSYSVWKRDFTGATPLFAVLFKPEYADKLAPMVNELRLFGRGYSWGGFESLLILGEGRRTTAQRPFNRMIRVSVGLEDPKDLIADLEAGFAKIAK